MERDYCERCELYTMIEEGTEDSTTQNEGFVLMYCPVCDEFAWVEK